VVAGRHPETATIAEHFRSRGASIAMLAGSGSTVFGIFDATPDVASLRLDADVRVITTWTSDRVERVTVDR
jgi:4-diphosphocytidyl-2C-methyl-D-erythritol kinase